MAQWCFASPTSYFAETRVGDFWPLFWIITALIAVLGVPFTLWWWKVGDQWADAEHKRFKPKETEPVDKVVVKKSQ